MRKVTKQGIAVCQTNSGDSKHWNGGGAVLESPDFGLALPVQRRTKKLWQRRIIIIIIIIYRQYFDVVNKTSDAIISTSKTAMTLLFQASIR